MNIPTTFFAAALFLLSGAATAQEPAIGDPEIAAIMKAANDVDIEGGKLASKRAASPEVRAFAEQMISEHTQANEMARDVTRKIKLKPKESQTSDTLKTAGKETRKKLKDLKGAAFDRGYIDSEVAMHQTVLQTIDKTLVPNAGSEEMKSLLAKVRPTIVDHLEHAKQLQAKLGGNQ